MINGENELTLDIETPNETNNQTNIGILKYDDVPDDLSNYYNISPFEYLNYIRIIHASKLLKSTKKLITDIASECGFDNISYFNRVFKRIMGITPNAYRKLREKK